MLSLNTASRTCRLGLKLHGPKFARLQLSLKFHFCPEQPEIYAARLSHALTLEGNSHVRVCASYKAAGKIMNRFLLSDNASIVLPPECGVCVRTQCILGAVRILVPLCAMV